MSCFTVLSLMACGGDDNDSSGGGPTPSTATITLTPANLTVSSAEGSYTVDVKSTELDWSATSSADWVQVSAVGTVATTGQVIVKVTANTGSQRTAVVTVKSRNARTTFTITQAEPMQVSDKKVLSRTVGDETIITVNAQSEWTPSTQESWISVQKSAEGNLVITTQSNESTNMREGTVTITAGNEVQTICVTQDSREQTAITTPEGYELVWNDEFNEGTELGSDWRHEVQGPGWVNNELQTYVNGTGGGKRVTELVDGKLRINCYKVANTIYSGRVYAKSNVGWTYGYMEARIKLPKGKGTWPAFWMMPVNFRSWPADGEIDIMEEVGANPNYVSSSLHANAHVHSNGTQVTHEMRCAGAESDYHVYAIKWTQDNITTYVDGQVQLSYDNRGLGRDDWPYDDPFYIILNVAWGGDWGGYRGIDESALPVTMLVDYVRVFQKK